MEEKTAAVQKTEKVKKTGKPISRKVRIIVSLCVVAFIVIVTNPGLLPFLPEELTSGMTAFMEDLFGDVGKLADMVSFRWVTVFQLIIMIALLLVVREIANWALEKYNPTGSRAKTMKNLAVSALKYLLTLVGFFWGLSIIGVNVSTLFASVGILALIIGFGAESLIADVITGLFIIFENQYNVGDYIELDGYRGKVVNIAIRTTNIEDAGGNVKIFNNSDLRNVINLSSETSYSICDIPVPYEADLEKAEAILEKLCKEIAQEEPEVFRTVPVYQGVQSLDSTYVCLRIVAAVREEDRYQAARLLNRKMKIGMEKAGMGVPHEKLFVNNGKEA